MAIWKFPIEAGEFHVDMPGGAEVIHVATQGGRPFFWALVTPEAPMRSSAFQVFGTGHAIPDDPHVQSRRHVGTFMLDGGALVFHLFEVEWV